MLAVGFFVGGLYQDEEVPLFIPIFLERVFNHEKIKFSSNAFSALTDTIM